MGGSMPWSSLRDLAFRYSCAVRSDQYSPRGEVTAEALGVAVGEGGQPPEVQVVFEDRPALAGGRPDGPANGE